MNDDGSRVSLVETYRRRADLAPGELWWAYFALGGNATPHTVGRYLDGELRPGRADHDRLAHALNERLTQLGQDSPVPYFEERHPGP
jgi:hypothetical protein